MRYEAEFSGAGSREYRVLLSLNRSLVRQFSAANESPRSAQQKRLKLILSNAVGTKFGQEHALHKNLNWDSFRRAIPIRNAEEFQPYLFHVANGEKRVLTQERTTALMETSGTTGKAKLLPVTKSWAKSVSNAQKLWALAMIRDHPGVALGKAFTIVSPAFHDRSSGGLPIGSNTGRMHSKQPWWVRRRYALPDLVSTISDSSVRQYVGLRFALQYPISSWTTANPSMILLYCRRMREWSHELSLDLTRGTLRHGPAEALEPAIRSSLESLLIKTSPPYEFAPAKCWPLSVVNCWKGGSAAYFVEQLPAALGGQIPIREVGVTASEGFFALPLGDSWDGGVLWTMGHVLEFVDQSGNVHWPWELKLGEIYRLIISTESGLYRYDIGDSVQVTGFCRKTPVVRFIGKSGRYLNSVGEKVNERQISLAVKNALSGVKGVVIGFTARIEWAQIPCLELAVEGEVDSNFASVFDSELMKVNIEYESKRKSGRLGPVKIKSLLAGAYLRYRERRLLEGAPAGQLKDPIIAINEEEGRWLQTEGIVDSF